MKDVHTVSAMIARFIEVSKRAPIASFNVKLKSGATVYVAADAVLAFVTHRVAEHYAIAPFYVEIVIGEGSLSTHTEGEKIFEIALKLLNEEIATYA